VLEAPGCLLREIAVADGLPGLDAQMEAVLAQAMGRLADRAARVLLMAWLGFGFHDAATLALTRDNGLAETSPVQIDRISPLDARSHGEPDGIGLARRLKGEEFHQFGAFFSRAYREHDYLLGRLHGAARLVEITASAGPVPLERRNSALKRALLAAILDEEEPLLRADPRWWPICAPNWGFSRKFRRRRGSSAFRARRCCKARGRAQSDVLAQRPQLVRDRIEQLLVVALGEIGAPDAAAKQHIAHNRQPRGRVEKHHMARRVAGAVDHLKHQFAHADGIAIMQPAVRLKALPFQPHAGVGVIQPLDPEAVALFRPFDGHAQILGQHARQSAMVHMAVGDEQLFDRHPSRAASAFSLGRSPPGSTSAPRMVLVHHTSEQFCWNAVTGIR
jgi:hypothetical protein